MRRTSIRGLMTAVAVVAIGLALVDRGEKTAEHSECGQKFGDTHSTGVSVAMADGSVRWISPSINPKVFEAISTVAGGESEPNGFGEE